MSGGVGRRVVALAATALLSVLGAFAAAAEAAAGDAVARPALIAPRQGQQLHAGTIRLVVKDVSADASRFGVFVVISSRRRLGPYGRLASCSFSAADRGCDFLQLEPWARHPGMWVYTATFTYDGYWAVTPGRYFWQANNPGRGPGGEVASPIGWFRVVG